MDQARWPELKERFAEVFLTKTRDEWAAILEPAEACATGVYGIDEAPSHPHNDARGTFVEIGGKLQPAPAPRFSRTPAGPAGGAVGARRRHRRGARRLGLLARGDRGAARVRRRRLSAAPGRDGRGRATAGQLGSSEITGIRRAPANSW